MPRAKTPRAKKAKVPLERKVLKDTLAVFKRRKIPHFRNNTGGIPLEDGVHKRRFLRAGAKDWPDVIFVNIPDGRFGGLELKRPGKRPTEGQLMVLRAINSAGGIGFWADDAEVVERTLDRLAQGWRVEITDGGDCFVTDEPK